MAGRKEKAFHEYIIRTDSTHVSQEEYSISPATAFLRYAVDAKDAVKACIDSFKKEKGKKIYTTPAIHSLQTISSALLPSIIGHFEMYQKYLFSGIFELTSYYENFDIDKFFKNINKETNLAIDLKLLSSYRGVRAPVGLVIADCLHSWHDPNKVNSYFQCFGGRQQVYSNNDIEKLKILWQLRHSIVHTAGTITIPDSHKLPELRAFGGKNIVFDKNFINEVARKIHPIIYSATKRLEDNVNEKIKEDLPSDIISKKAKLFEVKSKTAVWLTS